MSRRSSRFLLPLLAAGLVAGCGGSSESSSQNEAPAAKSAPVKNGGQLTVGGTESSIGDAIVGNPGGSTKLPSTKVPGSTNTEQGVGAGASCENADLVPAADNLATVQTATLCLLNGERTDAGLGTLKQNAQLTQAALAHSQSMVTQQFFDHTGKDGSGPVDRIRSTGYIPSSGTWTVGENLAWGTGTLATPKEIVAAWMKSTGHRENVLRGAFKEIGFGLVSGNPRSTTGNGATFTTTFGGVSGASTRTASTSSSKASRSKRARKRKSRKARIALQRKRNTRPSGSR